MNLWDEYLNKKRLYESAHDGPIPRRMRDELNEMKRLAVAQDRQETVRDSSTAAISTWQSVHMLCNELRKNPSWSGHIEKEILGIADEVNQLLDVHKSNIMKGMR